MDGYDATKTLRAEEYTKPIDQIKLAEPVAKYTDNGRPNYRRLQNSNLERRTQIEDRGLHE